MESNTITSDTELEEKDIFCRYLDLPKYIDLLRSSELYFAPATVFEDSLEGTLPELIKSSLKTSGDFDKAKIQEAEYQRKLKTNINCWSIGPNDNMALWKLYGRSNHSVSISTTFHNLLYSAPNWTKYGHVKFKKVKYIDHGSNIPDGIYSLDENIFGYKHIAYRYEEEVRIVITRKDIKTPSQLRLPVKLNEVITKVTVAPNAGEWFFEMVKDITLKYNISVPVEKSGLSVLIENRK